MTNSLHIDSRITGSDSAVLSLQGEVDVANSDEFKRAALALLEGGVKRLVVDLSRTEYIDSAGLGILVGLLKRTNESHLELIVAGAQPRVQRVFEITGLNRVFAMRADVNAAVQEVAS